jgi:flavin reductase (DIM6/NTAB) family NADH-FMN oxidoreductase RutF
MADPRSLRDAFGTFGTGVTIVTAADASGRPVGFTANSFTSVSLDPPMLLVCPARKASSLPAIRESGRFAVHVLERGQQALAERFARRGLARFDGLEWAADAHGIPRLAGSCARFACTLAQDIAAGDHIVLLGRILEFEAETALEPLLFLKGRYG